MTAWIPAAVGAGVGALSSLFGGGGGEETEIELDPLTQGVRNTLFLPTGRAGARGDIYNVWDLPTQTYGPSPGFRVHQPVNPQVAGFYQGLMNRAGGSPYERAATGYAGRTIRGGYLGVNPGMQALAPMAYGAPNPWLDQLVNRAQRRTARNVASQFGRSGMGGSSLEQGVATRELGNIASTMYGQAYDRDMARRLQAAASLGQMFGQERGLQQEAAFNAPMLANMDFSTLQRGLAAAQGMAGYGQRMREEDLAAHQFGQQAPYDRLGFISSSFAGLPTGGTTTRPGTSINPFLSALGGASVGYGLYRNDMFPGISPPPPPSTPPTVPYQTGSRGGGVPGFPNYGYGASGYPWA